LARIIQYVFMGSALVAAFFAGDYVMKLINDNSEEAREASSMVGQQRPLFRLPDLQGKVRSVEEWSGQVLVLNFWATWCPPCQREMPSFVQMQDEFASQGLQFVGIALDDAVKVENFLDTMGVEYPNLVGGDEALMVSNSYGNSFGALPYTVAIGRDGTILATFRGEVTREKLEPVIVKAL